jgi:hypothetical protein
MYQVFGENPILQIQGESSNPNQKMSCGVSKLALRAGVLEEGIESIARLHASKLKTPQNRPFQYPPDRLPYI